MEEKSAFGPYNLIAPNPVTNAEFMHTIAQVLHRPYWFHVSSFLLQLVLGEMSLLLTEGRASGPKRLIELGFAFRFGNLREAMEDVLIRK
jgi:NAD dependent epimerase/dehydratase family enzyme